MGEEEQVLQLWQRLECLEAQFADLNNALKNHLNRLRRRRSGYKAQLASFRRQAKKLLDRAPS